MLKKAKETYSCDISNLNLGRSFYRNEQHPKAKKILRSGRIKGEISAKWLNEPDKEKLDLGSLNFGIGARFGSSIVPPIF
jgi:hypothetical protein